MSGNAGDFVLVSEWHLPAPVERVWDVLHDPTGWPRWWRYVQSVDKLAAGNDDGIGARYRFHWSSRLPYHIDIDTHVVEIEKHRLIRAEASGELVGEGTWRLEPEATGTAVEYTWRVSVDKPWMRALAPLLRPAFAWNHNGVMAAGEAGLREWLERGRAA